MRARLLMVLAATTLCSCANYTQPVAPAPELIEAQRNFQAIWDASLQVLRSYDLVLDRQDRRMGIITTEPLIGPQWFEVWRHDAAMFEDRVESSLQTIYRTVTVTIAPMADRPEAFEARVCVQVARSTKPGRDVTNTSQAYSMFFIPGTNVRPRKMVAKPQAPKPSEVVHLGRDKVLEGWIAARIGALSNQSAAPAAAEPESL